MVTTTTAARSNAPPSHLELVKDRAYGERGAGAAGSAHVALRTGLGVFQRLLAPFLAFAAEEVWSWWRHGSVHRAPWPEEAEIERAGAGDDPLPLEVAVDVIGAVRARKSEAGLGLRAEVRELVVVDVPERSMALEEVAGDVRAAGNVVDLRTATGTPFEVRAVLVEVRE